jgi:hypothetical protein
MDAEARDTLDVTGLYVVPRETVLETTSAGSLQLQPGAPADFDIARDAEGRDLVWTFIQGRRTPADDR